MLIVVILKTFMESYDQDNYNKLKELVEEVKIAMLCTIRGEHIRSRPMLTAQFDDQGNIWFFTNEQSGKAEEAGEHQQVCLAYSSPSKNTYISISGTGTMTNDWAKMKELYNPAINAWFPKGLDDPDLALLKVSPSQAEYWDSNASKMVTLFNIARAIITGSKYEGGAHGNIKL